MVHIFCGRSKSVHYSLPRDDVGADRDDVHRPRRSGTLKTRWSQVRWRRISHCVDAPSKLLEHVSCSLCVYFMYFRFYQQREFRVLQVETQDSVRTSVISSRGVSPLRTLIFRYLNSSRMGRISSIVRTFVTFVDQEYLDFVAGISTCALGHADPDLAAAVGQQMKKFHHVSNLYYIPEQVGNCCRKFAALATRRYVSGQKIYPCISPS